MDIDKESKSSQVKIKITHLTSEQEPPICYEQTLPLNDKGEFDFTNLHSDSSSSISLKPMNSNGLLTLPGVEGALTVQPDGTIVLPNIDTKAHLLINTSGNIIANETVSADSLSLQAKDITLNAAINTKKSTILQAEGLIKNNHCLISKGIIKIKGVGKLQNAGLISADSKIELQIRAVENAGHILSNVITARLKHSLLKKLEPAISDLNKRLHFNNTGVIFGSEHLTLKVSGDITNTGSGEILSQNDIHIEALRNFDNQAFVVSLGKLFTRGVRSITNSGQMIGKQKAFLTSNQDILNSGLIESAQPLRVASKKLKNESNGCLFAGGKLEIQSDEALFNAGWMEGKEGLSLSSRAPITNTQTGKILSNAEVDLLGLKTLDNSGEITGHLNVTTKTIGNTRNETLAKMSSHHLSVSSLSDIDNLGTLRAHQLNVDSKTLHNRENAIMDAHNTHIRTHEHADNAGTLVADNLSISAGSLVNALRTGTLSSLDSLTLTIKTHLENAHQIQSKNRLDVSVGERLHNQSTGIIEAFDAHVHAKNLDNEGLIKAHKLFLDIVVKFCNHEDARLQAEQCLQLLSNTLDNHGHLNSHGTLFLDASRTLTNHLRGKIEAQEWAKLSSASLENLSTISAQGKLLIAAVQEFTNLVEATLKGQEIKIKADVGRNQGLIDAEQNLTIDANRILDNHERGTLHAGLHTELNAPIMGNSGNIDTNTLEVKSDYLTNTGNIKCLQTLSMNIQEIFRHCKEGKIQAEGAITLLAKNLQLVGQLMTKGDFTATVEHGFEYSPEALWACGLLKLLLKQGHDFTQPIKTPGSLEVNAPHINLYTQIESKNFETNTGNLNIQKGGIFADGTIKTNVQQNTHLAPNTYLASNARLELHTHTFKSLGEVYTSDELLLHALSRVENSSNITVGGNAKIIAPLFEHKMLTRQYSNGADALSAKPTFTVSKNCTLQTNTQILGGELHAGGTLTNNGSFQAHSFEAFRSWFDIHLIKGKRKKGIWKGHHYHEQHIPRHQTLAVYDSHVSSGKEIKFNTKHFSNEGAFRAPDIEVLFHDFQNGRAPTFTNEPVGLHFPLRAHFRENVLFGRTPHEEYYYGPKVPLRFNYPLATPVQLANAVLQKEFAPIIEKDLLQRALQKLIRSGYINEDAGSPEEVLAQLRTNALSLPQPLTLESINESDKPLIYFRQETVNGDSVLSPILYFPKTLHQSINMGTSDAVIRADNARLIGDATSTLTNTHRIEIDHKLILKAHTFTNQQQTQDVYTKVIENRKKGSRFVQTTEAVPNTGVIKGGTIEGNFNRLKQIGGEIKSTAETEFKVQEEANFKALQTSQAVQGTISRKGRNYQIEPVFHPAQMISSGTQSLTVQGPLLAEGLHSEAHTNTLSANPIQIKNAQASFELASTRKGRGLQRKTSTGGTSFTSMPSVIKGHELKLISESTIQLMNTYLLSTGDTTLKAKKLIEIINAVAESSSYSNTSGFRGLHHAQQKQTHSQTHALTSVVAILGNLKIESDEAIKLKAVEGYVQQNVQLKAPVTTIEGATEYSKTTVKTKTSGIDFFGSQAIESALQGHNSRQVLKHLLQEDNFLNSLKKLAHSKQKGDLCIHSVQTLLEGWRLIHSLQTSQELLGALTDRWGITTSNGQKLNPKFTFTFSQSTQTTTQTRVIPTQLYIGGELEIIGDIIKLKDGTEIDADTIRLHARQLLEVQGREDTLNTQYSQQSASVSVHADGSFAGASLSGANKSSSAIHYHNAILKARNLLSILSEGKASLKGAELEARTVIIQAVELLTESLQDTRQEKGNSWGASINADGNPASVQHSHESSESRQVNRPTRIHAQSLEIITDYLTQKGSILSASEQIKVRGLNQPNPLQWVTEDLRDFNHHSVSTISLNHTPDAFPFTGFLQFKNDKNEGRTRATVDAPSVIGDVPSHVHRDSKTAQVILSDTHSNFGIPIVVPKIEHEVTPLPSIPDEGLENDVIKNVVHDGKKSVKKPESKKPKNEPPVLDPTQRKELYETLQRAGITATVDEYLANPGKYAKRGVPSAQEILEVGRVTQFFQKMNMDIQDLYARANNYLNDVDKRHQELMVQDPFLAAHLPKESATQNGRMLLQVSNALKNSVDNAVNSLAHPVDTCVNAAQTSWDGWNEISYLVFGVSTQGSIARNYQRGVEMDRYIQEFENGDAPKRMGMATELLANMAIARGVNGLGASTYRLGQGHYQAHKMNRGGIIDGKPVSPLAAEMYLKRNPTLPKEPANHEIINHVKSKLSAPETYMASKRKPNQPAPKEPIKSLPTREYISRQGQDTHVVGTKERTRRFKDNDNLIKQGEQPKGESAFKNKEQADLYTNEAIQHGKIVIPKGLKKGEFLLQRKNEMQIQLNTKKPVGVNDRNNADLQKNVRIQFGRDGKAHAHPQGHTLENKSMDFIPDFKAKQSQLSSTGKHTLDGTTAIVISDTKKIEKLER